MFWNVLGESWERLGNILGPSWNILRRLGSDLGNLTAVFEMSWKVFCSLNYLRSGDGSELKPGEVAVLSCTGTE